LTIDSQGNLYGTTSVGGVYARTNVPGGTVFELIPKPDGTWTEEILHNFSGTATDGNTVYGGVIFDSKGNLYGTTEHGGTHAVGTVYELQSTAAPQFSPGAAKYSTEQVVTISDPTPGATIYYTTDGSTPSTSSTKYTTPITVSSTETINAIAVATGYVTSPVASATYTITTAVVTQTVLTSDGNPQSAGAKVTFTADVQPASGTLVPTGTVTFSIDGGAGTAVKLDGTGHASYAISSLAVGSHTVKASYSGNADFSASGATLSETIVGVASSITVISGSGQTTAYGSAFANPLVVLVKDGSNNPIAGTVVSFSGAGLKFSSASATTATDGKASVMATGVAAGSLTGTATATGVSGSAVFSLTATKVGLTITANDVSVSYGQAVPPLTYTATGFVNGDTVAMLSGEPVETTTATKGSPVGTYTIAITQGTLVTTNYTFTVFDNGTLSITSLGITATPAFSVAGGTYTSTQSVTISDSTPGVIIYYTTNETTPTTASTKYTGAIIVGSTETIEAIAVAPGYSNSGVATAAYTINVSLPVAATPTFSPAAGTYTSVQSVTISDSTSGAAIYYTTNGSTPTAGSTAYSGSITVGSTETLTAIAVASGYSNSAVATATYTINLPAPTFTLATTPTSASIRSGQSASFTLTATPQNGFVQTISFSCSGLPSGDTCSFSPSAVKPSGASVSSTMTISSTSTAKDSRLPLWGRESMGVVLALVLWPFFRRKTWRHLAILLLILGGITAIGCGGHTKSQNYSVTVTASGGGITQTSSVSLTVTQ